MEEREPMTVQGELLLKKELEILLSERPKISKEIAAAREFGDLKEIRTTKKRNWYAVPNGVR